MTTPKTPITEEVQLELRDAYNDILRMYGDVGLPFAIRFYDGGTPETRVVVAGLEATENSPALVAILPHPAESEASFSGEPVVYFDAKTLLRVLPFLMYECHLALGLVERPTKEEVAK